MNIPMFQSKINYKQCCVSARRTALSFLHKSRNSLSRRSSIFLFLPCILLGPSPDVLRLILLVLFLTRDLSRAILPYRNLDTLVGKAATQTRALNDAGEFLGGVDLEYVAEAGCQDGRFAGVENGELVDRVAVRREGWRTNVYEGEAETANEGKKCKWDG